MSPSSTPPAPLRGEPDLEITAELPVLDPEAGVETDEPHAEAAAWAPPPAPPATAPRRAAPTPDSVRQLESQLQSVAAQLRETQELLRIKGERLVQVERARDEAHAALAAAERRAAIVIAELAQRHAAASQHAAQLQEATRARAAAGERPAVAGEELAQARTRVSTTGERAAPGLAGRVMADLVDARARATSYLESLQTVEARRLITEALLADMQHEAEERETELALLARELAGRGPPQPRGPEPPSELSPPLAPPAARTAPPFAQTAPSAAEEPALAHERGADAEAAPVTGFSLTGPPEAELPAEPERPAGEADREARAREIAAVPEAQPPPRTFRHSADEGVGLTLPLPPGTVRLLIRKDDHGSAQEHVLRRRTTIGRTRDNDLQIEAKFISRHHAVILAGPAHTIIEDRNSTNGVLVNGQRITRQTLSDGDEVIIGRTLYRFVLRRGSEKP